MLVLWVTVSSWMETINLLTSSISHVDNKGNPWFCCAISFFSVESWKWRIVIIYIFHDFYLIWKHFLSASIIQIFNLKKLINDFEIVNTISVIMFIIISAMIKSNLAISLKWIFGWQLKPSNCNEWNVLNLTNKVDMGPEALSPYHIF